ncbi:MULTISPECIES: ABC transporter substrate-binding protein [unclassified Streptomyces]|uniref:ABC transporter substrate-binding protein n=1 Tax=unclassified Streptomyces TaxID=2593676 RepID=UPI000B87F5F2|nr:MULTISPECIES: ABC transporter substrate-binding protein [unclassified Streptomyces]MYZ38743.1 ABC transporter substrate-binding protein [Streptomyces sp. SID4917]
MTGWRRSSFSRPFQSGAIRTVFSAVMGASLLAGCGVLPGGSGGSREPVTVMTWAPIGTNATNQPGMPAMAKAYARWVNANGGIDGHTLRILTCDEKNESGGAADCARRAVKENAVAVVGSYSQHGREFMAPLEAASIPFLGGYGLTEEEFNSFLSYPVNGGQATLLAGNGRQLAHECERTALVRPDTITGDDLPELLNSGLGQGGRGSASDIRAAEDATDYTRQAEQARAAAEDGGCVTAVLGDRTETFFDSYRRVPEDGRSIRVSSVLGSVSQPLINSTGGKNGPFEGAYLTGWYPVETDPAWNSMRNVIDKYAFGDNDIDPADPGPQTTWIAYTALKQVIESINDNTITAGKIADTLDRGLQVNTGGLTPPLRWRYEDMLGAPGFPRIVNRDVTFQVVREGRLISQKKGFIDVGQTLGNTGS